MFNKGFPENVKEHESMRDIRGMRRDVICATGDAQRVAGTSGDADAHAPRFVFYGVGRAWCTVYGVRAFGLVPLRRSLWRMFEQMFGARGEVVENV